MLKNNFVRIAFGTALLMLVPLYLTFTGSGVDGVGFHWTLGDFIFMYVLIFTAASLFELARRRVGSSTAGKWGAILAFLGLFLLVWVNGAVGIIGDSDINMLYAIVALTIVLGALLTSLNPKGMFVTLLLAAAIQFVIPVIALIVNTPDFSPGVIGVFVINTFFVAVFAGAALLFRSVRAA